MFTTLVKWSMKLLSPPLSMGFDFSKSTRQVLSFSELRYVTITETGICFASTNTVASKLFADIGIDIAVDTVEPTNQTIVNSKMSEGPFVVSGDHKIY
jgi:predicted deacetylase